MSFILTPTTPTSLSLTSPFSLTSPISPFNITTTDTPPYVTSINISYSKPLVSVYENVEADTRIHRRVIKFYYGKTVDEWLYDELLDLLNYLTVKGDKVDVISSMSKYNPTTVDKDSQEIIDKKVDFLEKFFFKKTDMAKILYKYIKETGTSWYNLGKNEYFIRQLIKDFVRKRLRRAISDQKGE